MKELTIDQKAKRYDELKVTAQELEHDGCFDKITLFDLFPELKESEDEKIRKSLIDMLKNDEKCYLKEIAWLEKQGEHKSIWHNEDEEPQIGSLILLIMQSGNPIVAKIIEPNHTFNHGERWAYIDDLLENQGEQKSIDDLTQQEAMDIAVAKCFEQGEQKPADKVEPKFKNGQWIVWQDKCYKVNDNGCGYELVDQNGLSTSLEYGTIDGNAHIWDIAKDAKDGDVLVYGDNPADLHVRIIMLFKSMRTFNSAFTHFHIFGDSFRINDWCDCGQTTHPTTKEQRDTLERAMTNAGYRWNKEELKLEKI